MCLSLQDVADAYWLMNAEKPEEEQEAERESKAEAVKWSPAHLPEMSRMSKLSKKDDRSPSV